MPKCVKQQATKDIIIPQAQIVVGNVPFVRSGRWATPDTEPGMLREKMRRRLTCLLFFAVPDLFTLRNIPEQEMQSAAVYPLRRRMRWVDIMAEMGRIQCLLPLSADSSVYFQLYLSIFVTYDARLAIVGPQAWLQAAYAKPLRQALLKSFFFEAMIISASEPWFTRAAVKTAVFVLHRRKEGSLLNAPCHFVRVHAPLKDLKGLALAKQTSPVAGVQVRSVKHSVLRAAADEIDSFNKWTPYLRAPDVYFEIIERCRERLTQLRNCATIRAGVKSGINNFFYLRVLEPLANQKANTRLMVETFGSRRFRIESRYLRPLVRGPRDLNTVSAAPNTSLKFCAFVCRESRESLRRLKHQGALEFINWGESHVNASGRPWPQVLSVQGRKHWWFLPELPAADVLLPMSTDRRLSIFKAPQDAVIDHNFFTCTWNAAVNKRVVLNYVNSALFMLFREVHARVGLGGGAAKLELSDWNAMPIPQDLSGMPSAPQDWFGLPVRTVEQELERKERRKFDAYVLQAVGLEPGEYLERICGGLKELVMERGS